VKRTSRNPTRRVGPRTGAIPVREADVQRILNKIFRSKQVRAVRGQAGYVMLHPARSRRRLARTHAIDVTDKIESYATGKVEPLLVSVLDKKRAVPVEHSTSGGWQSSKLKAETVVLPKRERVARLSRAIEALGKRVTPKRIERLLGTYAARRRWVHGREARIALVARFGVPLDKQQLRVRLGDVLRHELAHAMDETARQDQMARWRDVDHELEDDTASVVYGLGLPRSLLSVWNDPTLPPKRSTPRPLPEPRKPRVFDDAYYNDPKEITARLVEIFHELDHENAFKTELDFQSFEHDRNKRVLRSMRWTSDTFNKLERRLTPKNFARVMKAVYDRYHAEPWFPQATGVYKNRRRTSRRRTSRP
jgi:hypothetical protein